MDKNNIGPEGIQHNNKFDTKTSKLKNGKPYPRVLALTPMNTGFGYAVFESPNRIIDFGVTSIRVNRQARSLLRFEKLLNEYKPDHVACLYTNRESATVARKVTQAFHSYCKEISMSFETFDRNILKQVFGQLGVITRYDIVDYLIDWLPALDQIRPKKTAVWESEDPRMKAFDAAAVAVAYYARIDGQDDDNT